jgi:hypothetical protein
MSARRSLPIDQYQVGVICALPHEMTAVTAMLDEEDEPLKTKDAQDSNTYALGRMGQHNVVIACLPAGVYGTTAAASVAKDMLRTCSGLRFGLMVGIGGGIPNTQAGRDIRLGDIVVSQPDGTFGGVVQYDVGKNLGEGRFVRKGSLDRPPHSAFDGIILASVKIRSSKKSNTKAPDGNEPKTYLSKRRRLHLSRCPHGLSTLLHVQSNSVVVAVLAVVIMAMPVVTLRKV